MIIEQIAAGAQYVERFGFDNGTHLLGPLSSGFRGVCGLRPRDTG